MHCDVHNAHDQIFVRLNTHFREMNEEIAPGEESVFSNENAWPIFCISQEEVLFVGIIDTLVPFKMKKKAEFMAKSLLQHGQNFSVRDIAPLSRNATNISTVLCVRGLLARTFHGDRLAEGHVLYRIPPAAATLIVHTHAIVKSKHVLCITHM